MNASGSGLKDGPDGEISFRPIGWVRTSHQRPYDAPRQANWDEFCASAVVELRSRENFEQAVKDLEGCDRIWLLTYFDRVENWKPLVLPPRGRVKRGVFATRSPHRPNPIGLTCVRLLHIDGLRLHIEDSDLLDGTPVLDIKPYLPYADAFTQSAVRWVDEDRQPSYQIDWDCDVDLVPDDERRYVERVLRGDPFPHPYRRIRRIDASQYMLSLRRARFRYRVQEHTVVILEYTVDLRQ